MGSLTKIAVTLATVLALMAIAAAYEFRRPIFYWLGRFAAIGLRHTRRQSELW